MNPEVERALKICLASADDVEASGVEGRVPFAHGVRAAVRAIRNMLSEEGSGQ